MYTITLQQQHERQRLRGVTKAVQDETSGKEEARQAAQKYTDQKWDDVMSMSRKAQCVSGSCRSRKHRMYQPVNRFIQDEHEHRPQIFSKIWAESSGKPQSGNNPDIIQISWREHFGKISLIQVRTTPAASSQHLGSLINNVTDGLFQVEVLR